MKDRIRESLVAFVLCTLLLVVMLSIGVTQPRRPQTLQDSVQTYVACYAKQMHMDPWVVSVVYGVVDPGDSGWVAGTEAYPDYYEATVTFDTLVLRDGQHGDSVRRAIVVHELVHVLEWELGEVAEAQNPDVALRFQEQLATRVGHWPLWQRLCRGP